MLKQIITTGLLGTFTAMTIAHADIITIDNLDLPTPETTGAQSNYSVQSFTPDVAGIGLSDTVAANSPLPGTVFLEQVSFIKTPDGGNSTAGQIFLDLYEGVGDAGTFLGSSSTSLDINNDFVANDVLTWSFAQIALDSATTYAVVFSTDAGAGNTAVGRLTAANNGGGFVNTYDGGTADLNSDNSSPVPFDSRFQVVVNTVPEPSVVALLLIGGVTLAIGRRRARHG